MANERRLIDIAPYENMVDASVCQIQVYRSGNGYCDVMNFNTKNIPTVDAVEVVRCAQCCWNDRPTVKGQAYCSECATIEKVTDSNYKSQYCPDCGARMDGGADNGEWNTV